MMSTNIIKDDFYKQKLVIIRRKALIDRLFSISDMFDRLQ